MAGTFGRWTQLIDEISVRHVDAVIVFALSRIARDSYLQETVWRQLKAMKTRLISVTEPASEDTLVRGILGAVSQVERERLGKFVNAALTERVRRGQHVVTPSFGLRLSGVPGSADRRVERDPDTFPIAREMAERYLRGETPFDIIRWLDAEGVTSPTGKHWSARSFRTWLQSPGIAGAVSRGDVITWDAIPPIVSRDEFELIQHIGESRRNLRPNVRVDTWLRGSIFHACGRRMIPLPSNTSGDKRYYSYTCLSQSETAARRCDILPRSGSQTRIEHTAKRAIATDLSNVLTPQEAIDAWVATRNGGEIEATRKRLLSERGKANSRHERAEALYLAGKRGQAWLVEEDALHAEALQRINSDLSRLEVPPDPRLLARTYDRLTDIPSDLGQVSDDVWQQVIRQLGRIIVDGDTLRMEYQPDIALHLAPVSLAWRT